MSNAPTLSRIAYLTGEYPTVSHTFILREVEALRRLGATVETCAIRATGTEHHRGQVERDAAATTFYVLAAARNPLRLVGHQITHLVRTPARYAETLTTAWRLRSAGWRSALYQLFYFAEATVLAEHLRRMEIGHLHNHFAGPSATVALLAARLANIPFSFTLHGPADLAETTRWRLSEKIVAARFVACISHYARSQAMLVSDPLHWSKLRIVHCGIDPTRYGTASETMRSDQETRLLFVGRIAAAKGLPVLLQAMIKLRDSLPSPHLTVVGDGPGRVTLEEMARTEKLPVTFLGYQSQDEVAELMSQCDLFVLPSFAEGVPVVLMEAMASGRPVIAPRITGVPELVDDGTAGRLFTPGDPDALAAAIAEIATLRDAWPDMGAAGRQKVQAEFNCDMEASRLLSLFRGRGGEGLRPDLRDADKAS